MKYLFFALLFSLPAFATEVIQWENIPLPIALHVGQERIVDVVKSSAHRLSRHAGRQSASAKRGRQGLPAGEYGVPVHPNPAT